MEQPERGSKHRSKDDRRLDRQGALGCGGCALSAVGATAAMLVWGTSSRTQRHLGGGFEGEDMDYTVLATELPFVALAGAVLPALVCLAIALLLGRRGSSRR
ncbi:hypothetical protein [Streptomyces adelaidensis]|uniref:hypothetical protein n=1 Tax=Streptomyces adelaidensis TaxID=2796465 RepID=UPI001F3613DE|nr:hypothetical protein [Streptomyces adelaidensis]